MFGRKAVLHEKPEDKKKGEEKRGWRGDKKADMKDPSDFSVPEVGVVTYTNTFLITFNFVQALLSPELYTKPYKFM